MNKLSGKSKEHMFLGMTIVKYHDGDIVKCIYYNITDSEYRIILRAPPYKIPSLKAGNFSKWYKAQRRMKRNMDRVLSSGGCIYAYYRTEISDAFVNTAEKYESSKEDIKSIKKIFEKRVISVQDYAAKRYKQKLNTTEFYRKTFYKDYFGDEKNVQQFHLDKVRLAYVECIKRDNCKEKF